MISPHRGYSYTVTLDDDPVVPKLIENALGVPTEFFDNAAKLVEAASSMNPVAVFVDIHLNENADGLAVIPQLRRQWPFAPILVVTADPSDEAVSKALASGADDFIRKPIRPRELLARVQTRLIDQAKKESAQLFHFGNVELNKQSRCLRGSHGERFLSPTEMNLFLTLAQARGTVVPRPALKQRCWDNVCVSDNALDRKVHELRKALEDVGSSAEIATAYGAGFFMTLNSETESHAYVAQQPI